MCFRLFTRRFVSGLLGTMVAGSASAQSPLPQDAPAPPRIDIASFASAPIVTARPVVLPLPATHFWDNGPRDDLTAHLSQIGAQGTLLAADDFFIKSGQHACVESITVCFAIADTVDGVMVKPDLTLTVYADCDGRPDDASVVLEVVDPELITATPAGPSMWSGFNLWTIEFRTDAFLAGHQRLWISPRAHADFDEALYYWVSANNGGIQGAQAQISGGAGPWQDVQECDCPGLCTDLYFLINGGPCCLVAGNMPFDATGGVASLQLFGAGVPTRRAVDNFQLPPGEEDAALCRVEAWVATNCPLDKFFLEIYPNECDGPGAGVVVIEEEPTWTPTGQSYLGCPIYHLVWTKPGHALEPGQDYWLSVVGRGTGSLLDKAYWMFKDDAEACHIEITEAKHRDPYDPVLESFVFVEPARDLAFKVFVGPVDAPPPPPIMGACCLITESSLLCADLSSSGCAEVGEFFDDTDCQTFICPGARYVACCLADGACVEMGEFECTQLLAGESMTFESCTQVSCPQPPVACCFGDGSCADLAEADCTVAGGLVSGEACQSTSCHQPTGACCLADGACADLVESECANAGGAFVAGEACATYACPQPDGACCYPAGGCAVVSASACDASGGAFHTGDCAGVVCPDPTRACCFGDGACADLSALDCASAGGADLGPSCAVVSCPQPGACCLAPGACVETLDADCAGALGGTFFGGDCGIISCPLPPEACCFADGSCAELSPADCASAGGTTPGEPDCASASCPASGACCFEGLCYDLSDGQPCTDAGGEFSPGADCTQLECDIPLGFGACCLQLGDVCEFTTLSSCDSLGGTFSLGQSCQDACAGVCCINGGAMCIDVDGPSECAPLGGTFVAGTTCVLDGCNSITLSADPTVGAVPARGATSSRAPKERLAR